MFPESMLKAKILTCVFTLVYQGVVHNANGRVWTVLFVCLNNSGQIGCLEGVDIKTGKLLDKGKDKN